MGEGRRHQWGEAMRYEHSTTRMCLRCGLVKVTRHEPNVRPWVEFVRDCEPLGGSEGTPACEPVAAVEELVEDRDPARAEGGR